MMHPLFLTTVQVAALLDLTPAVLLAQRERMARDTGFPDPMPTSRAPFRWRRDQVLGWIAEQGLPRSATAALPPRPQGRNILLMEEARRA